VYEEGIVSLSKDSRYMRVAPFTFQASTTYTIQVVVTLPTEDGLNPTESEASLTFQIGASGVISQIEGGPVQSVSAANSFDLDASSSYSVDYPDNKNLLSFAWLCTETSPKFGNPCPGFTDPLLVKNLALLSLPEETLSGGSTYNFTVIVTGSGAVSSTSTLVSVSNRAIPRINMINVAEKYNPSDKIVVSGTIVADPAVSGLVSDGGGVSAQWSAVDGAIDIAAISLTPSSWVPYVPESPSYVATFQLSLAPNSLTAGLRYDFQLSAKYETHPKSTSIAYVSILVNEPPKGGVLAISPSSGYALNETFAFRSSKWSDDIEDFPLQYTFGYYNPILQTEIAVVR
jgi:hypothetical protein